MLSCHTRVTGARRERALVDSWFFSVTTALGIFDQTEVLLLATVLIWIPRSRGKLSVAVSSWCFQKHPLASVATADDSHLANKSIMRKATARDEPASPVSSDIAMRGQRGVTARRIMEIRSNWSSLSYLGPHFCLNECIWWSCLESRRGACRVSQRPSLFADLACQMSTVVVIPQLKKMEVDNLRLKHNCKNNNKKRSVKISQIISILVLWKDIFFPPRLLSN